MPASRLVSALWISWLALGTGRAAKHDGRSLEVRISIADGLLNASTDGRVSLMFAPAGVDVLEGADVTSEPPNKMFGLNVYNLANGDNITLSGGSGADSGQYTRTGVYGWPSVSLSDVSPGNYTVQAFLNKYEKVTRSDGSTASVRFPCGDGAPNVDGYGSLVTDAVDVQVLNNTHTIDLTFDNVSTPEVFTGNEIGGCAQGNYEDTEYLKYIKIRSHKLSKFWRRDMYVGANVLLPHGYNASDRSTRYPVVYSQGHWPADQGAFRYPTANYSAAWDTGMIPGAGGSGNRTTPKMIMVTFRHESPFYDDSYGVNTANIGPYGDAINDELILGTIDKLFNTIPHAYGRIAEGGSTGGWISAANVVYRPDVFGACFSSYPDSLDFHRHQDIPLYDNTNAYYHTDGSAIGSIRTFRNDTEVVLATVQGENHWELTFGTSSRSFLQWDAWNAVFGAQGLNGYPLEPWNKVTGEIYPDAVNYWPTMGFDLSRYITDNFHGGKNLGEVLRQRMFIYVGSHDTYYLNEGVAQFQQNVEAFGGPGWANVTVLAGKTHGGNYQSREIWDYLELLFTWFQDHAPDGKTPLPSNVTTAAARGNNWNDIIRIGGHEAALDRQAPPSARVTGYAKRTVQASVGRWDPGVMLEAQWKVNGKLVGECFAVKLGQQMKWVQKRGGKSHVQLVVTGRKMGYNDETRYSEAVRVG